MKDIYNDVNRDYCAEITSNPLNIGDRVYYEGKMYRIREVKRTITEKRPDMSYDNSREVITYEAYSGSPLFWNPPVCIKFYQFHIGESVFFDKEKSLSALQRDGYNGENEEYERLLFRAASYYDVDFNQVEIKEIMKEALDKCETPWEALERISKSCKTNHESEDDNDG